MSEGRTTFAELRNAAIRAKRKADEVKGHVEEIATALLSTAGSAAGSATIGVLDEWKGEVIENGVRMHKVGNLPTGLAAGLAFEAAAALGAFGKMAAVGYSLGQGGVSAYSNTVGRLAGARLREKSASETTATKTESKSVVKKTGTAG